MSRYRWRRRRGPGRPAKPRLIGSEPKVSRFIPIVTEDKKEEFRREPITLSLDEFEALRLVDYEGLTQEETAQQMGVSRGTVWRCLDTARRKIATMIVEGRELLL